MTRLIECVPNFSEGRDPAVIQAITDAIETVAEVKLLDVDPGNATNRTVVTFAGEPEFVIEAAVRGARRAKELIDMSRHSGEHPRFGAMDVCPLVPVSGVTMEETVEYARELARRLGEEVGISVFCYENAAFSEQRRNLADVRQGEYEGLEERLTRPEWKPDFGPADFDARWGATAVSARDFLIAYNVNLNTTSSRRANAVAFDVREKGRIQREGNPLTGPIVKDEAGETVWLPGTLKCVKAIGWFIEEYGVCQISMNLTNVSVTPLHVAFDECVQKAAARGMRVTGSEVVGLLPLGAMLDAGRYFLRKQKRSTGVSDEELIKIAVKSMGMDDLAPFDPDKKIIEYVLAGGAGTGPLASLSLAAFTRETASESPAPGGGSVAAAVGAFGAALGTMVANLSSHKRGWDERWNEFSDWAEQGKAIHEKLTRLIDEDTHAFDRMAAAFRLPQGTDDEAKTRDDAIQAATRGAIEVPLTVMETALSAFDLLEGMARDGLPATASDAGVGAACVRTAVLGAHLNVRINVPSLTDESEQAAYLERAAGMWTQAQQRESEVLALVEERL